MQDITVRPLRDGETAVFEALADAGVVGRAAFGARYQMVSQGGEYRPEWTWVAWRGDRVVARAAWWGAPDDDPPYPRLARLHRA
jgi:hypothetical protein